MRTFSPIAKSALAGLVAGMAGTFTMTQFQNGWTKASRMLPENRQSENQESEQGSENATMKVADKIAKLAGRQLTAVEKKKAGQFVHYAFGTTMGAFYGVAEELLPKPVRRHAVVSGMAFGATLFAIADETAVPKLGLSSGSAPLSSHVYALASHLVYGVATGLTSSLLRKAL